MLLVIFLFVVKAKGKASKRKSNQAPFPPGPTPWPIIGNPPEIWRKRPAFRWIHGLMKEHHTDILCARLANSHVVAVTSPVIAPEFLKKNDSVFASRPVTMATEYSSRRFLTIAVVPWGDQWKKMRKVVTCDIVSASKLRSLLENRIEEADNLVRFIYNQCKSNGNDNSTASAVVNLRLGMRQYSGNGHEKTVCKAMKIVSEYQDPLIDERVQEWREGKRTEPEDLLDAFILAKDSNGKPSLSIEEIRAQCAELMLATVDNPSNAVEWAMAEMINQLETLLKAVEEIDSLVGKERLVLEADIP
ncbi:Cytochrome p450 79a2, putative [Theobroma cacao]|uniref:Cytochrome p450 79a2, putative n=1 Tax=Theobroma cacao TaxID=3641 RepID=A0A061FS09_THECC|nr:Cytochrome p450 79a2, putative [Theobroma cacao]